MLSTKEQHVAPLAAGLGAFVRGSTRHGEPGEPYAQAVARRLVHLPYTIATLEFEQVRLVDDPDSIIS